MLDSDTGAEILHPMGDGFNAVLVATDWIDVLGDRSHHPEILPNIERIRVITDGLQSHANNLTLVSSPSASGWTPVALSTGR